ncbi:MAG TPA: glycosyltransferase family 9 protein [Bdellovibrionales bacterium]|nr:glycosyltransferase family 9 protein [Bdellovibrionales bacterium]
MRMQPNPKGQALFVRLDRIGDLVLTLPVDQRLGYQTVHWWIPQGLSFVTKSALPIRNATEIPKSIKPTRFLSLLKEVRSRKYSTAVVFHAPWWVGLLLWLAGIPVRVGVRSQWHSFLFFNRGVRQKRSRAEYSELEYNYRLVEEGLGLTSGSVPRDSLKLKAGTAALEKFGLLKGGYTVIHPGMSGSALNWPTERYEEMIRKCLAIEPVVITGTASDEKFLAPLRERLSNEVGLHWLDRKLSGTELLEILGNASGIVAPSTGVLHLAASTGRPTIGIYSPVRVQKAKRWGPQGERVSSIEPEVNCPGELSCLQESCPNFGCMGRISVDAALEKLRNI